MASKRKQAIQLISSRVVYRGPVFQVVSDDVVEPGGIKVRRDVVRHQGSVLVWPWTNPDRSRKSCWSGNTATLPAISYGNFLRGRIHEGESELAGAKRELWEETGYTARSWKRGLFFYSSPGFLDETMAIYAARTSRPGKAQPEADEKITTRFFPLSDLVGKAVKGTLRDGKTIAGNPLAQARITQRQP